MQPIEILLVEDNDGDIFLITEALGNAKIINKLNVVKDGKKALEYLEKKPPFASVILPDLILLDINLPKRNGLEVLQMIKENEALKTIPVIILTTSSSQKDVMASYANHANCFITKPVDAEQFLSVVATIENFWVTIVTLPGGTTVKPTMIKDNLPYRILVIEDNIGDAELIQDFVFEQIELPQIEFAKNFKAAKQILATDALPFDVVLLDLTLPDKSGKALIEAILQLPKLHCPVIVLTGFEDMSFSKGTIQLGVSDYLVKDQLSALVLYKSIIYAIERYKFTLQLEESEKKFSTLFELSPQPMWVYDIENLRFMQVNKASIDNYGYSEKEFLQMSLPDLVDVNRREKMLKNIRHLKSSANGNCTVAAQHRKKSGDLIDVEIFSSLVMFNNKPCRSAIVIDVTQRRKAERALQESEKKYRNAQRLGKMGNWELNLETGRLTWSDEIYAIFGIEQKDKDISYEDYYPLIHPDDKASFDVARTAALAGIKKLDFICRILKRNGEQCYVHELGALVTDDQGKATYFLGTVQDVTQQTEVEIALRQSEARLKGIIELQSCFVVRLDMSGNYTYCNQTFLSEYSWIYGQQDLIGENAANSIMEYDRERVRQAVEQCLLNPNKIFQIEIDKPGKGDTVRTTLWDFVFLPNEHNQAAEIQCVGIDITEWKKTERKFVKTLEERNTILESIGDAFFALDHNWTVTYWNNEAEKVSSIARGAIVGKNFLEVFPETEGSRFLEHLQQVLQNNSPHNFEIYSTYFHIWWEASVFPSENGMSVYLKNITRRKKTEEVIANNERQLQVLFDTVSEIIFMVAIENAEQEQYRFTAMNAAGLTAMGLTEAQVVGQYVHHVIPSPSLEVVLANYKRAIAQHTTVSWLEQTTYPSGEKTARVSVSPVYNDAAKCNLLVGSIRDITDQLAYEEKLKTSAEEMRELALHLQYVREEERLNIAREIHDELGQQLTGIKMDISWLKRKLKTSDTAIETKLQELLALIDDTIKTVRKIAAELRPSILDDLGLSEALNWLSEEFTKRSGIPVQCFSGVDDVRFDTGISIAIFRIYQESLTNILRHAQATEVVCHLVQIDNILQLIVRDNGNGFDQQVQNEKRTLGLLGMKERVMQLNGEYDITSAPGKGTLVSVSIPIL